MTKAMTSAVYGPNAQTIDQAERRAQKRRARISEAQARQRAWQQQRNDTTIAMKRSTSFFPVG